MRRMASIWGAVTCAVVLLGSAGGSASASPGGDAQLRQIKIAIIGVDATGQVMYAKHRGFFAGKGSMPRSPSWWSGTQTVAALLAGEVQFTGSSGRRARSAEVSQRTRSRPSRAARYYGAEGLPTTVLVAAPGERITRARDLCRQARRGRLPEQHRPHRLAGAGSSAEVSPRTT